MAIAFDAAAASSDASASPFTWTHTVTGNQTLLIVGVALYSPISGAPAATAVTYKGISMWKVRSDLDTLRETSIWMLQNPPDGPGTVSVTATLGTSGHGGGVSVSYSRAQQSNYADNQNTIQGSASGDQTFTVTTTKDRCWTFAVGVVVASTSPTIAADQTSRGTVSLATAPSTGVMRVEDSNGPVTPAGSSTVGFTIGGTTISGWVMSAISFGEALMSQNFKNSLRPRPFTPGIAR